MPRYTIIKHKWYYVVRPYADDSHQLYSSAASAIILQFIIYHNKTKSSVVTNMEGIRTTNGTNRRDAQDAYECNHNRAGVYTYLYLYYMTDIEFSKKT